MPRFFDLSSFLPIVLIATLSSITLFRTDSVAQENPVCFMVDRSNQVINLNRLCKTETAQPTLLFKDLKSQLIFDGNMAEVKGTVTNSSSQVIPLSNIYFQLVADNRVISSSAVEIAKEDGLKPGESMAFEKVISKRDLGNVPPSAIQVQVTRFD
ncbi:MAG TPA: hypothetical protein DCE56_17595 [Cyanobacteria bacterium UBA8553]|nr:hypothetical protein [Cyanobacteria bacterium UBA8553]HAJ64077.1 hypothetical protein [Cyanobacteria bacterium UBA8543]